MGSPCLKNFASHGQYATKHTPSFAISGVGGRVRGRGLLLPPLSSSSSSRKHGNGSMVALGSGGAPGNNSETCLLSSAYEAGGIGIAEFVGGKNFLVTGGTGFLAKVLIEKILRTNPEVGKIYVMIKAKDTEAAVRRLQNEVVDTTLFKCLREIHGKDNHSFVGRKLVPVIGDIREANLGIAPEIAKKIMDEVDIIINSAGNTNFHERYDVAMDINTLGPFRIMTFAQQFRQLKLFLQISTAYVNGLRQGVVLEKPFRLGDAITDELQSADSPGYLDGTGLDFETEVKLAFESRRQLNGSASSSTREMRDLGLIRARIYGWQDTYVFTKAMGEMVINSTRGNIPVVIVRRSVIESTFRDPFPGWIQGNRMVDPVIINYGKGLMTSFLGDPDCVLDVVPADMVVNATLASMAKHGRAAVPGLHVYQVASSSANPMHFAEMFRYFFEHFTASPFADAARRPIPVRPIQFRGTMEQYARDVEAETNALLRGGRRAALPSERWTNDLRIRDMVVAQIMQLGRIYEPYTFYGGRFDTTNTAALLAEMSAEERARFNFDVRDVDWENYFTNVHIPGLRKHVMKGRGAATSPVHLCAS